MRGSDTSTSRVHATGSSGIEVVGGPSPRRPPADLRDVPHTQEPLDVRLPGRPLSARESISLGFGPQRRGDQTRGPGWYGQYPASPSGGGNHGQQGQGRFEELQDRGEQVAEGEAGGEEGQGRRLGFLIVGKLDQELAAESGVPGTAAAPAKPTLDRWCLYLSEPAPDWRGVKIRSGADLRLPRRSDSARLDL